MKRTICVLSVLGVLLVGSACGKNETSPATTTSAGGTTTTSPAQGNSVRVYFARNEKVATAGRPTAEGDAKKQAVEALLAGPNDFEKSLNMSTEIPAGTKLLGVTVANDTATVDLSSNFQSGAGSLSMQLRAAEVVFTLTQFADVKRVTITFDGKPVDAIGEGIPAKDLDRARFENVTPRILVESPVPGQSVTSPLKVSGIAKVFEGTINYSVNDPDGLVLDQGFTTASAGTDVWGDFTFTSNYTTKRPGVGRVIVWSTSMADGSHQNVYETPVNMS